MADYYGLGYVDTPAVPGHDGYVGRLSISYRTQGGVRAMKFRAIPRYRKVREGESPSLRALDDSEPKYLGIPGQKPRLYNVNDLLAATDVVAVCEGELDTVVASQVVGVPAVGVAGTAMWRDHLPRVFAGIPRVLVIADNDAKEDGRNPGRELGERIAGSLDQATVITPPSGDDLTDWLLRDGVDAVRKAMGL